MVSFRFERDVHEEPRSAVPVLRVSDDADDRELPGLDERQKIVGKTLDCVKQRDVLLVILSPSALAATHAVCSGVVPARFPQQVFQLKRHIGPVPTHDCGFQSFPLVEVYRNV